MVAQIGEDEAGKPKVEEPRTPLYEGGPIDEFLISPVRKAEGDLVDKLRDYKTQMASAGKTVHLPFDDTVQEDPIGFYICVQNKNAMQAAKTVGIYLDPDSTGSVFDVGMAFQADKMIKLAGMVDGKDIDGFSRFIIDYADLTQGHDSYVTKNDFYQVLADFKEQLRPNIPKVSFRFQKPYDKMNLAMLGMVFMEGKSVDIVNIDDIVSTPHKSYENVVIAMHNYSRNE